MGRAQLPDLSLGAVPGSWQGSGIGRGPGGSAARLPLLRRLARRGEAVASLHRAQHLPDLAADQPSCRHGGVRRRPRRAHSHRGGRTGSPGRAQLRSKNAQRGDRRAAPPVPRGADPARAGRPVVQGHRAYHRRADRNGDVASRARPPAARRIAGGHLQHFRNAGAQMTREEANRLLHAYIDRELDPAKTLELEAHLAENPSVHAACGRLRGMSAAIRDKADYHAAPAWLEARVRAAIPAGRKDASARPTWWRWLKPAGSFAVAADWLRPAASFAAVALVTWVVA